MPDIHPQSPQNEGQFVKKSVEMPILDSSLRQKISSPSALQGALIGIKGFYNANKIYFWAIFAGLLIIIVLAYFAFRKPVKVAPKEANVSVNVEVPETVASGGEAVYKITAVNNDSQKLVKLELEVAYPEGVTFESSSPKSENLSGTLFAVPDLISGQNAAIFLKAKVSGSVNDEKTLNLKLHYSYSNFNSEFIKQQSVSVRLLASDVSIELQGPGTANNAQLVIYTIKYQNNSGSDIKNARIKMAYPDGFSFASATPLPDLGSDTWNINSLVKDGSGQIQIQGNFSSINPGESKTATAEFLILGPDGSFFTQNSSQFVTAISSLPLLVAQVLDPDNPKNVINPGDNLIFRIKYQNNASTVASGVNVEVDLDSKVVDLGSIRAEGGQVNNNAILWNASTVPQLENLGPNQGGQLSFSLQINNPATRDAAKNLTLVSNIKIKSTEYSTYFPGNQLSLKVSSPSRINRTLSFVSGQLPPQVGRPSVYKVRLTLTNSSNDFSNGILTAFIPLGPGGLVTGTITGSESGNTQYDASTGKLTWNVGSLPANTGRFGPAKALEFQVRLNPSASQVGQSPVLLKDINFTAKDLFTSQDVNVSADNLGTGDVQGGNGFSNGQVMP